MKNIATNLFLGLLTCFVLTNCARPGWNPDSKAANYEASAKKNDGSCKYNGSATFWMNGTPKTNGNVDVRLNNQMGTISVDLSSQPSCGAIGCANFKDVPVGTYNFVAEDQFPVTYQEVGEIIITANSCQVLLLN